jgi:hypothetical protein
MVPDHTMANMTTASSCNCMSYDDGTGYIQTNCNYAFQCTDSSVAWLQRVGVEDTSVGCEDAGGGMELKAELHQECTAVETHMGTTYQMLLDPYSPEDACGSAPALLGGTIDSCGAPSASAPVLDGIDLVAVYESLKAGDSVVPTENPGTNQYSYTDPDGFKFLFSSQENLNKYTADPTAYPLGAGGYCALAVSGSDPACDYDVCTGPACLDSADTNMIGPDGKL